jgi:hypothetical protein
MKKLILSMLVLCLVIIVDGDVVTGNSLPDWGTVCIASEVRSGPEMLYPVIGSISAGETVRLHDQSRPDGTWVSIAAAQWIPIKALCE